MKQKVVIRVQMEDSKRRSKAMKVAVGLQGVLSAAIEGADKNQLVVIGDGVDSITLTTLLRKQMGFAELISVAAVEEKKDDKKDEKDDKKPEPTVQPVMAWPSHGGYAPQYYYVHEVPAHYQEPNCCIM